MRDAGILFLFLIQSITVFFVNIVNSINNLITLSVFSESTSSDVGLEPSSF